MITDSMVNGKINEAWQLLWEKFFSEKTSMIYDYLPDQGKDRFRFLPTPAEIKKRAPNPCGWGTGMEDSMINGGAVMSMLCDMYECTLNEELKRYASMIFKGMVSCAEVHGVKGFIARSICIADGKSVYPESSRDQYTHYVHGIWKFYNSPLSNDLQREKIKEIADNICLYSEKYVTRENDYYFNNLDGKHGVVSKMWQVEPHEVARLPMIYAAGWQITGKAHWHDMYRKYALKAAHESLGLKGMSYLAYALLQMQASLELLYEVEKDDSSLRNIYLKAMKKAAYYADHKAWLAQISDRDTGKVPEISMFCGDWRNRKRRDVAGYSVPYWEKKFLTAFMIVRESGEAPLLQLMCPGFEFASVQSVFLKNSICRIDYAKHGCYGFIYSLCAYWRAVKLGIIKEG